MRTGGARHFGLAENGPKTLFPSEMNIDSVHDRMDVLLVVEGSRTPRCIEMHRRRVMKHNVQRIQQVLRLLQRFDRNRRALVSQIGTESRRFVLGDFLDRERVLLLTTNKPPYQDVELTGLSYPRVGR